MSHRRSRNTIGARTLLEAIRSILSPAMLGSLPQRRHGARWTPTMLVYAAILTGWAEPRAITDRFNRVNELLVSLFPSRRRVGVTYMGFSSALVCIADGITPRIEIFSAVE